MSTQIQITPKAGITIGSTEITSGTDNRILFQNGGKVSQSSKFTYNGSLLTVGDSAKILSSGLYPTLTLENSLGQSAQVQMYYNQLYFNTGGASSVLDSVGLSLGFGGTSASARLDIKSQGALSTDLVLRVRNSANTANLFQVSGDGSSRINGFFGVNMNASNSYPLSSLNSTSNGFGVYGVNNASNGIGVYGASSGINNNSTGIKGESATAGGSGYRIGAWLNASGGASNWALYVENGDFSFVSTNGTKIGTSSTQKLSFYGATPIARPSSAGISTVADIVTVLTNLGLLG